MSFSVKSRPAERKKRQKKMDKDQLIKKLESLTKLKKLVIVVVVVVLFAGAYWWFLFKPQWDKIPRLEEDIANLEQNIQSFRKKVKKLPELEKQMEQKRQELIYAQNLLPESGEEIEQLLASIEGLGKEQGIEFLMFTPGSEQVGEYYAKRSVQLRLEGQFHNLMSFFSKLSGLDRLVTLEHLRLNPQGAKGEQIVLNADSRIFMYRALTDQEKAAQKNK